MLGYMTAKEAKEHGFTNHASYFGIPVYVSMDADFNVATKWAALEPVFTLFTVIEQFLRPLMFPNDEPSFQFKVGRPL